MKELTIDYLQRYIRAKDHNPSAAKEYFLKLTEETGELSRALRKKMTKTEDGIIKNTIDEDVWDVIYYAIAIANCYDIDLTQTIKQKEEINNKKYNTSINLGDDV